jgi:hypothetical protein
MVARADVASRAFSHQQEAFLSLTERTAIMLADRGAGKTHILLTRVLHALLTEPGAEGLVLAPRWLQCTQLIGQLRDFDLACYLRTYNKSLGLVTFANGSRLHCRPCGTEHDIHALRGLRGLACVALDEADHCDFQHLYGVVQTLIRPSATEQRAALAPDPGLPPEDIRSWAAYEFATGMAAGLSGQTVEQYLGRLVKPGGRIWLTGSYSQVGPLHLLAGMSLYGKEVRFMPRKDVGLALPDTDRKETSAPWMSSTTL